MAKKAKAKQSVWASVPKSVYGAVVGLIIGTLAVVAVPEIAIDILVGLFIVAAYVFFVSRRSRPGAKWSPHFASPAPVLGALVIGISAIAGVHYLGVSLAWHPQGAIKKSVQNVTAGGPISDANDASSAVSAKPGDVLRYTIVVSNTAANAANHDNDMASTVMTDTLPTGVELVSNPSKRAITENENTILPGQSVTKTYDIKVTATQDGTVITNEACFNANSVVNDNPQHGCDKAVIKVHVPPTPPTPTPPTPTPPTPTPPTPTPPTPTPPTPTPPTPTPPTPTPPTPETPTPTPTPTTPTSTPKELPNTGAKDIFVVVLFTIIVGYIFSAVYGYAKSGKSIKFR
jgi:uncharacterized repeat protein (TIGR01451 family)